MFELRLLVGMLALAVAFVPVVFGAGRLLEGAANNQRALDRRTSRIAELALSLQTIQAREDGLVPTYAITGDPAIASAISANDRAYAATLATLSSLARPLSVQRRLSAIRTLHDRLAEVRAIGMAMKREGATPDAVTRYLRPTAGPLVRRLNAQIRVLVSEARSAYDVQAHANEIDIRAGLRWLAASAVAAAAFSLAVIALLGAALRNRRRRDLAERRIADQDRALAAARKDLVEMVAHDLKNPLTVVLAMADRLERRDVSDLDIGRMAKGIESSARSMDLLIRNLLEDVRPDGAPRPLDLEDCDVGAIVRDLLDRFGFLAERRGVELDCYIAAPLPTLRVDCARLEQVLSNLIGNALKFTGPGDIISVGVRQAGPMLTIEVRDTGCGMDRQAAERAFDRYWQATGAASRGTGLGLAISKRIVEAHGGTISVASEVGMGATFTVALPVDVHTHPDPVLEAPALCRA